LNLRWKSNLRTLKLLGFWWIKRKHTNEKQPKNLEVTSFWWIKRKHRKIHHTLKLFALRRTGQQVLICDGCWKIIIASYFQIHIYKLEAMNSFMYGAISVEVNY
jgi:hypothetical protein